MEVPRRGCVVGLWLRGFFLRDRSTQRPSSRMRPRHRIGNDSTMSPARTVVCGSAIAAAIESAPITQSIWNCQREIAWKAERDGSRSAKPNTACRIISCVMGRNCVRSKSSAVASSNWWRLRPCSVTSPARWLGGIISADSKTNGVPCARASSATACAEGT